MSTYFWKFKDFIREVMRGKSNGRIISNWRIAEHCRGLRGTMIDLGGGDRPSYGRYWNIKPDKLIRVDIDPAKRPDVVADMNKTLPFEDDFADHIFLFSAIYIVKDPRKLFGEVWRILKPGGTFYVLSPFIFPESREPADYARYTSEGLETFFNEAGFTTCRIEPIGERGSVAASLFMQFVPLRILRVPYFAFGLLLDKIVPRTFKSSHPAPLAYFCIGIK